METVEQPSISELQVPACLIKYFCQIQNLKTLAGLMVISFHNEKQSWLKLGEISDIQPKRENLLYVKYIACLSLFD